MDSEKLETNRVILNGGRRTESVVRIGNTVHRSMSSNHDLIHKLLLHLNENGFGEAPVFLGIDSENKEVLSYLNGEVPAGSKLSYSQISHCIKMLRRYHDVASSFKLCGAEETICHNDFAPWNVIFKDGKPVGIIDFDDCKPGSRIEDVAYFLWTFLELGDSKESDLKQISMIVRLCKDYDLNKWTELTDAITFQQMRILKFREDIVRSEQDKEKRDFSARAVERIRREMDWVGVNRERILEELSKALH